MKLLLSLVGILFSFSVVASANEDVSRLVFNQGRLQALVSWEKGPQSPNESVMQIEWQNDLGAMMEPGNFRVVLFMPAMGHGSAPTQVNRVLDAHGNPLIGVFEIVNVYFSMGGDWDVQVILMKADGTKETQVIHVHVEGGGGPHHG